MCTVTLAPDPEVKNGFVLTSNRDEAVLRKTLPPQAYFEGGCRLLYPRDMEAGGTWIGLSEKSRAVCLLNGAFEKHLRNPPYRKSRGVVVKDLLTAASLEESLEKSVFHGIEPFTALLVDFKEQLLFLELVWDGDKKHLHQLPLESHIRASALLYSPAEIEFRKKIFREFELHHLLTSENLLKFHSEATPGSKGLIIDRGFLKTCSITQLTRTPEGAGMWYTDLGKENREIFFRRINTMT